MALRDPEQAKLLQKAKPKRSKYNARRVRLGNIWFDSQAEAARYVMLLGLATDHFITDLRVHVPFRFKCGQKYIADFVYVWNMREVVEDVKGGRATRTRIYSRNKAMMRDEFGIEIKEVEVSPTAANALVAAYKGATNA